MKHATPKLFSIVEDNNHFQKQCRNSATKSYDGNSHCFEFGKNTRCLSKELQSLERSTRSVTSNVKERVAAIQRLNYTSIKSNHIGTFQNMEIPNTTVLRSKLSDVKNSEFSIGSSSRNRMSQPSLKNCSWSPEEDDRVRQSPGIRTQQTKMAAPYVGMTSVRDEKHMYQTSSNLKDSRGIMMTHTEVETFIDQALENGLIIPQREIGRELHLFHTRWERKINRNLDMLEYQLDEIGRLLSSITISHLSRPPYADICKKQRKHNNY